MRDRDIWRCLSSLGSNAHFPRRKAKDLSIYVTVGRVVFGPEQAVVFFLRKKLILSEAFEVIHIKPIKSSPILC